MVKIGKDFFNSLRDFKIEDILKSYKSNQDKLTAIDTTKINVIFFPKDGSRSIKTIGKIDYSFNVPIVFITNPARLGIVVTDNSIFSDSETFENCLYVREDSPYSMSFTNEIYDNLEEVVKEKKNSKITLPINIKNIKYEAIKINLGDNADNPKPNELIEFSQQLIYTLGHVAVLKKLDSKPNDGMLVAMLIGALMGGLLTAMIITYIYTS